MRRHRRELGALGRADRGDLPWYVPTPTQTPSAPSRQDREVTRTLADAGRLLDIPLHDHVILGAGSYFSFRDSGLL